MRQFYVTLNGQKQGPMPEARVVAALNAGKWLEAEFADAATGEVVSAHDLTHGGTQIITKHDNTLLMAARDSQAQGDERPPWEGGAPVPGSRAKRPTTRYQQAAMDEISRESRGISANPYTLGQGGFTQAQSYTQPFGGGYAAAPVAAQSGVPWHGIIALLVSLVCWPAGLYMSSKARESNHLGNFYLGTAGYIVSALGAIAWAVRLFLIIKENNQN